MRTFCFSESLCRCFPTLNMDYISRSIFTLCWFLMCSESIHAVSQGKSFEIFQPVFHRKGTFYSINHSHGRALSTRYAGETGAQKHKSHTVTSPPATPVWDPDKILLHRSSTNTSPYGVQISEIRLILLPHKCSLTQNLYNTSWECQTNHGILIPND